MPATLKDYPKLVKFLKDEKELFEYNLEKRNGKEEDDHLKMKDAIKILSHDPSDFLLVHYEETTEDSDGNPSSLSKEYWEQHDIRVDNEQVFVMHEHYDDIILYSPNTQSLILVKENEERPRDRAFHIVGIFEHQKTIDVEYIKEKEKKNVT